MKLRNQFIVFVLFTIIVPIALLVSLLLKGSNDKLEEKVDSLLNTGVYMAKELLQMDLKRLEESTNQAATFSIAQSYRQYYKTRFIKPLRLLLGDYQKLKHIDFYVVFDHQGEVVLSSSKKPFQSFEALKPLIHNTLLGQNLSSLEFRKTEFKSPVLTSIATSPIYTEGHNKSLIGGVIMGMDVTSDSSVKSLLEIIPDLNLRVFLNNGEQFPLLLSTLSDLNHPLSSSEAKVLSAIVRQNTQFENTFMKENSNQETYQSKVLILRNSQSIPIGLFVISTSITDLVQLQQTSTIFTIFVIIACILIAFIGAFLFDRQIILPVKQLSDVSSQISLDDLSQRLPEYKASPEIYQMSKTFNKMLDSIAESQSLRSMFVATLTHDLRTPLLAQKRVIEIFDQAFLGPKDDPLKKLSENLFISNETLLELVNKLLETYQYEEGQIIPEFVETDIHNLIAQTCESLESIAHQKSITMLFSSTLEGVLVTLDPMLIRRVISNLIGNALQNIGKNKQLTVTLAERTQNIEILVHDNGPGISPEVLPHIFKRYYSGDKTRQKLGSGLGLFICKMIIDLHSGKIEVHSEPGMGTTFVITLPFKQEPSKLENSPV